MSPESTGSSFKVIRKGANEINFDERRKSPFEKKAPKLIANIYESSLSDFKSSPISATTVMTLRDDPRDAKLKKSASQRSDLRTDSIKARRAAPPPPKDRRSQIRQQHSALLNVQSIHSPASSSNSRNSDGDSEDDFL